MSNSTLDQQQIFQKAFDESSGRIKVDAELTSTIITPPGLEVSISAIDDNIAIRNSNNTNELLINSNGSINTNILNSSLPATQSGIWSTGRTWNLINTSDSVNIGNFPATQAVTQSTSPWIVSGSISLPSGASTSANQTSILTKLDTLHSDLLNVETKQDSENTLLSSINSKLVDGTDIGDVTINNSSGISAVNIQDGGNSITVDGNLGRTWTLLNSTDSVNIGNFPSIQPVSQSGTWNIGTLSTISNVVHIDDNSGSLTVDNSGTFATQASQSGTWNINNISGTISLPTGAATSSNQTTANSSLSSIDGKLNSLGQKTMANSTPVAISSDQSILSISQYYRLSEIRSRTFICKNIQNTTGTIYTVTGGKTFYLTSIGISALDSSATAAQLVIRDGANSSGDKLAYLWQAQPTLGTPQPFNTNSTFENNPIPFTTDIRATQVAGTIVASVFIIGYEE